MYINEYINFLETEKRYSQHTITAYKNDVNGFFQYIEVQYETSVISNISTPMLRSYIASLIEEDLGNRTINRKLSAIKSYFNYCKKKKYIDKNIAESVKTLKIDTNLPVFVEEQSLYDLIQAMPRHNFVAYRDFLIVYLLYALGLRRAELISLKHDSISLPAKQIRVMGKGNKERLIPLSDQTVTYVKEYLQLKEDTFNETAINLLVTDKGKKLYPNFIYRKVNKLLIGATTQNKRSPHTLRHSFATHLLNKGADIMSIKELLGHESLEATQIYTHTNIDQLKKIYKKSHPSS